MLLDAVEGTRAYLFVWFALATGARRGEICGLKWDCVDLEKATVHLCRNKVCTLGKELLSVANKVKTLSNAVFFSYKLDLPYSKAGSYAFNLLLIFVIQLYGSLI